MSKLSPNDNYRTNVAFLPSVKNGGGMRASVLELDDQIQTIDSCMREKWISLRDYLAADADLPQRLTSPLQRLRSVLMEGGSRLGADGKFRPYIRAKQGLGIKNLRVSSEIVRFAKEQEASYVFPTELGIDPIGNAGDQSFSQTLQRAEKVLTIFRNTCASEEMLNRMTNGKYQEDMKRLQEITKSRPEHRSSIFRNLSR